MTAFEVLPTADDVEFFRTNGYLAVDQLTTDAELAWFREICTNAFDPEAAGAGHPIDRSGVRDEELRGKITQFFHPELRVPDLLQSIYFTNAKRFGAALLGVPFEDLTVWSHFLRKAPGGPEVPPHQDEAFWPPDYDYRNVAVWLPLHDVTVEMGSMQFLPGSHRDGVRRHRHYDHPSQILLEVAEELPAEAFVACPLRAGGATFHDPATIHRTASNQTDQWRLAFPMTVQTVPRRRDSRRVSPWLDEFTAAVGGAEQSTYMSDGQLLPLPS